METVSAREWRIDRERAAEREHSEGEKGERGRAEEAWIKHTPPSPPSLPARPGDVLTGRKRPPREEGGRKGGREEGGNWEGQNRRVKLSEEVETERVSLCDRK